MSDDDSDYENDEFEEMDSHDFVENDDDMVGSPDSASFVFKERKDDSFLRGSHDSNVFSKSGDVAVGIALDSSNKTTTSKLSGNFDLKEISGEKTDIQKTSSKLSGNFDLKEMSGEPKTTEDTPSISKDKSKKDDDPLLSEAAKLLKEFDDIKSPADEALSSGRFSGNLDLDKIIEDKKAAGIMTSSSSSEDNVLGKVNYDLSALPCMSDEDERNLKALYPTRSPVKSPRNSAKASSSSSSSSSAAEVDLEKKMPTGDKKDATNTLLSQEEENLLKQIETGTGLDSSPLDIIKPTAARIIAKEATASIIAKEMDLERIKTSKDSTYQSTSNSIAGEKKTVVQKQLSIVGDLNNDNNDVVMKSSQEKKSEEFNKDKDLNYYNNARDEAAMKEPSPSDTFLPPYSQRTNATYETNLDNFKPVNRIYQVSIPNYCQTLKRIPFRKIDNLYSKTYELRVDRPGLCCVRNDGILRIPARSWGGWIRLIFLPNEFSDKGSVILTISLVRENDEAVKRQMVEQLKFDIGYH